jgi:uncharacterized Fe-S cluster-containing radical SAM superfamily protein
MQVPDDIGVPVLACSTERFIVACVQVSAAFMKSTNGIQIAMRRSFANGLIQRRVVCVRCRMNDRHAQQNTPAVGPQ